MHTPSTQRRGRPRKFSCEACLAAPKACAECLARRDADRAAYNLAYHRAYYHTTIKRQPEKLAQHRASSAASGLKSRRARGVKPRKVEA